MGDGSGLGVGEGTAPAVGVTGADGSEGSPKPAVLPACTVNVYATPLDSPVTVQVVPGTLGGVVGGTDTVHV